MKQVILAICSMILAIFAVILSLVFGSDRFGHKGKTSADSLPISAPNHTLEYESEGIKLTCQIDRTILSEQLENTTAQTVRIRVVSISEYGCEHTLGIYPLKPGQRKKVSCKGNEFYVLDLKGVEIGYLP